MTQWKFQWNDRLTDAMFHAGETAPEESQSSGQDNSRHEDEQTSCKTN